MNLEEKSIELQEQVLSERDRLSSDRMDISFGEIINLYKDGELVIRPEYQRLYRWTPDQKTALIESILLSIPIPPIFVAEDENGIWELVDGLQRVATIVSFFGELKSNITEVDYKSDEELEEIGSIDGVKVASYHLINKWVLDSGSLIDDLEGFSIDNLPTKLKLNIKRAVCRVEILRGGSSPTMKYELFRRLNSGGSKLKPMEIRNAIYRGLGTHVSDLLVELSSLGNFKTLTNLSSQKQLELYDQELILRFVAFYKNVSSINENTEKYLNNFMENASSDDTFNSDEYRSVFIEVLDMIAQLDDSYKIFRNHKNTFVPAYFEGILIGIAENIELYRADSELLRTRISQLKKDEDFKRYSGSSSSSKSRNKNRLNRAITIFGGN